MKICICGKGGCGKSSILSLLAYSLTRSGKKVYVLDSDESNNNLFRMIGFDYPPQSLMDFAGGKSQVKQKMRSRFSKGEGEPDMAVLKETITHPGSLPDEYIVSHNGLSLMVTGKIQHALEGCACAMGSVTREFVKHTSLNADELMLIDTEAGIEHFGRGVEAGADCVIGVVEPSLESISLAKTIRNLTIASGSEFPGVIVNKINSGQQKEIVAGNLHNAGIPVIGYLSYILGLQDAGLNGFALSDISRNDEIEYITGKILQSCF